MPTIRELAKMTGISAATISRVLNNNPCVSEENRRRVLEAVRSTGYVLPKKQDAQPIILAIYGRLTFWEEMYQAIAVEAKRLGYTSLSYCVPKMQGKFTIREFEKDGLLFNPDIAGILLSAVELEVPEYRRLRQRYPIVFTGNPIRLQGGCAVSTDDFRSTYNLMLRVLDEGRTRIGVLEASGFRRDVEVLQAERLMGVERALYERGLKLAAKWEVPGAEQVQALAAHIAAQPDRPDCIFCMHAVYAMAMAAGLRENGVRVPEDIAICSFDLDHFPKIEKQGSWYVRQNFREIGRESVRMLDGLIHHSCADGKRLYLDGIVERR